MFYAADLMNAPARSRGLSLGDNLGFRSLHLVASMALSKGWGVHQVGIDQASRSSRPVPRVSRRRTMLLLVLVAWSRAACARRERRGPTVGNAPARAPLIYLYACNLAVHVV